MTQEEVDLIYDYLHANYEYVNGELIAKVNFRNNKKIGDSIGCFIHNTQSEAYLTTSITINKKRYRMKLIKFIFIYHYKKLPQRIYQIDKNPMNTKIENLKGSTHSEIQHLSNSYKKSGTYKHLNKDGTKGFNVLAFINSMRVNLGTYRSQILADEVYSYAKILILEKISPEKLIKNIKEKYPMSSLNKESCTGYKGVSPRRNKFVATRRIDGKRLYLGIFDTPEEAHQAYLNAKADRA